MKKARKKRAPKRRLPGPLTALGWNRAFVNPKTGKDLPGNWVHPDAAAARKAATHASKQVFRDTAAGAKAAARAGLL